MGAANCRVGRELPDAIAVMRPGIRSRIEYLQPEEGAMASDKVGYFVGRLAIVWTLAYGY